MADPSGAGCLGGSTDSRYTFGRYFSPFGPNRPTGPEALYARNDVVLYGRAEDPTETRDLAADPAPRDLVARYSTLLEDLITAEIGTDITAEIGTDARAWVTERPRLLGWPTWHGDNDHPAAVAASARG